MWDPSLISATTEASNFYRATRMHTADYAVARCLSVRPFVCHMPVLCLNDYTYCHSFYGATRMHSVDYAVKRCLSVRPSVCHTPVLCLNGYTYPQSFFSPSSSPTILVFPYQTGWQYSDGDPLTGASNARGMEKITIFYQYRALSRN